jgi:hypothetical protein
VNLARIAPLSNAETLFLNLSAANAFLAEYPISWKGQMRVHENTVLAVMSVISVAALLVFGLFEMQCEKPTCKRGNGFDQKIDFGL